jgi:hypothetical protein
VAEAIVLMTLGRLLPPDPPEKWKTIAAALESEEKTRRFCLILLVSSVPLALLLILAVIVTGHIL